MQFQLTRLLRPRSIPEHLVSYFVSLTNTVVSRKWLKRLGHEMDWTSWHSWGFVIVAKMWINHGWRKKNASRGGLPTLPGLYLSTFQPSDADPGYRSGMEKIWIWGPGSATLVSETLYLLAKLTLLHMQAELIPWKILHSLKVYKFGLWRTMSVCYFTLSLTPRGLNLCRIVKTVHKTSDTLIIIPNIDSSTNTNSKCKIILLT